MKKMIVTDAHCDIPCGLYDPAPAKIAAQTVLKMVKQIMELELPEDLSDKHSVIAYQNMIERRIANKEKYAQTCKEEISILWSDFFKDEHLKNYPDLHDLFWKALKLCSKNKQEIDEDLAKNLTGIVDQIAKIFYEVKGDPARFNAYKEVTDPLI